MKSRYVVPAFLAALVVAGYANPQDDTFKQMYGKEYVSLPSDWKLFYVAGLVDAFGVMTSGTSELPSVYRCLKEINPAFANRFYIEVWTTNRVEKAIEAGKKRVRVADVMHEILGEMCTKPK